MGPIQLDCLDNKFLSYDDLKKEKSFKRERYPEQLLLKLLNYNKKNFGFLDISASVETKGKDIGLSLSSGRYIGTVPIYGLGEKAHLDLVVKPRFSEDIVDIANMLQATIEPEYGDIKLANPNLMRAPIYQDCVNYFIAFLKAMNNQWTKFETLTWVENVPSSSTNWKKYALGSYNPENAFCFDNHKNVQSPCHREWFQLTYILKLALDLFAKAHTPWSIRHQMRESVAKLTTYANTHKVVENDHLFTINNLDPFQIRELKTQANILLTHKVNNVYAWRMDSAELFERYVQYIVHKVGRKMGATMTPNARYSIHASQNLGWGLRYLEPDVILRTTDFFCTIDAKYKAHMMNTSAESMKDVFRSDLHQVLAYSSFDPATQKHSLLIYPYSSNKDEDKLVKSIELKISSTYSSCQNHVSLVGIPFNSKYVDRIADKLVDIVIGNEKYETE